jgi:glutamyl/glutaminyl-tRNA synthetase
MTNTPRQMLILQALGLPIPRYAHVALLLGMDGAPLSKRHTAVSLHDLRRRGYLPAAIRNHLVRLGHTPTVEGWLNDAAMREDFDLARLGKAAARFDEAQLRHWQKEAVAHLSPVEFDDWIAAELPPGLDPQRRTAFEAAIRPNVELPSDVKVWADVMFGRLPDLSSAATDAVRDAGERFFIAAAEVLARGGVEFKSAVHELGQLTGRNGPSLYMPLRAALTGEMYGPELAPMLQLIPQDEVKARLDRARRMAA